MARDTDVNGVQLIKSQVSIWSLGAVAVALAGQFFALGVAYSNLNSKIDDVAGKIGVVEIDRAARRVASDQRFDAITAKLAPFETVVFRLTTVETTVKLNNEALNARLDRVVDSLGNKMDTLAVTVNDLRSDVKVLSQKVDAQTEQKKAELSLTPPALSR